MKIAQKYGPNKKNQTAVSNMAFIQNISPKQQTVAFKQKPPTAVNKYADYNKS